MITNYKMFEDIRKGADYYDGRFFVDNKICTIRT